MPGDLISDDAMGSGTDQSTGNDESDQVSNDEQTQTSDESSDDVTGSLDATENIQAVDGSSNVSGGGSFGVLLLVIALYRARWKATGTRTKKYLSNRTQHRLYSYGKLLRSIRVCRRAVRCTHSTLRCYKGVAAVLLGSCRGWYSCCVDLSRQAQPGCSATIDSVYLTGDETCII